MGGSLREVPFEGRYIIHLDFLIIYFFCALFLDAAWLKKAGFANVVNFLESE